MTPQAHSQSPSEPLHRLLGLPGHARHDQPQPDDPPADPPETPQDRDPGEGSAGYSTGSSAAEFIADAGPEFDTRHAPPAPDIDEPPRALLEEWDEPRIREILTLQGEVAHELLRVGVEDQDTWIHTEKDLRAIAPPLTRILNRYDATRALAAAGDEALLAAAVVRYGTRNYTKRRRLLAAQRAAEPQPVTGVPAPENTGPEDDEQWQRVNSPPALVPKGARR